jgi:hypothetical protein
MGDFYYVVSKPSSFLESKKLLREYQQKAFNKLTITNVEMAKNLPLIGDEYLVKPECFQVNDHNKYRLFEYETHPDEWVSLGDIVYSIEQDRIGVVIQTHGNGEFRTDMFGNDSFYNCRFATMEEIEASPHYGGKLKDDLKK